MIYTNSFKDFEDIPWLCTEVVRNSRPVEYAGGFLTPIRDRYFNSTQEMRDFFHAEGRNRVFEITRHRTFWKVIECVQMPTKKQALERLAKTGFGYIHDWRNDESIFLQRRVSP